jgi:Fur family ferric uptake transcriptional regulator
LEYPLIRDLHQAGYRLTPQREVVLGVLSETREHLTAREILRRARRRLPRLNKSAVYRALDVLTHLSLVNPIDVGQGEMQYELHAQSHHHHHLVCQRCGKIADVDESVFGSVEKILRAQYGFAPFLYHFAIFGICQECRRKSKDTRVSLALSPHLQRDISHPARRTRHGSSKG